MIAQTISYPNLVAQFMSKYGQTIRNHSDFPSIEECQLRLSLIKEEAQETIDAINRIIALLVTSEKVTETDKLSALTNLADGLADLKYVVFGADLVFGLPAESIFVEVHRSNMTKPKLGHDQIGQKVQKGLYSKPNLAPIIKANMVR
jgi:predicted HAD superfamily Cof-like phosphohydrolase